MRKEHLTSIIYVIIDGVSDRQDPRFGNKTPLEVAKTPNLDSLAAKGVSGLVYPIGRGAAPESDAGVLSLLGYDVMKQKFSRGVLEAMGGGLKFEDGDLALRCNFATVDRGKIVDRRAGRDILLEEANCLFSALRNDHALKKLCQYDLASTVGHRCALVLYRGLFSDAVSNTDPEYIWHGRETEIVHNLEIPATVLKCVPLDSTIRAKRTADALNRFAVRAFTVLNTHPINIERKKRGQLPANFLLMRDAGAKAPRLISFWRKFNLRGIALVNNHAAELGIAKAIGIDAETFPPEPTIESHRSHAERALKLSTRYDFVSVHLKGPDEPAHDGDFMKKVKAIESIDQGFFSKLANISSKTVVVTADHSTSCFDKAHTGDPVPILIVGESFTPDGTARFTEASALNGRLGVIAHGYEVLRILLRNTPARKHNPVSRHR
jgi:2,3-bisphosphoglycerate-independent phosphoglycerate mutase